MGNEQEYYWWCPKITSEGKKYSKLNQKEK